MSAPLRKKALILPDRLIWHPLEGFVERHGLGGRVLIEKWEKPRRRRGSNIFWKMSFIARDGEESVTVPRGFVKAVAAKVGRLNRGWAMRYGGRIALEIETRAISPEEADRRTKESQKGI